MILVPVCLRYPGGWVDLEDRDAAFQIQTLLSSVESIIVEAALALGGYLHVRGIQPRAADRETWERDAERRRVIEEQVRADWGVDVMDFERIHDVHAEVARRMLDEAFREGRMPDAYQHALPFMYAKSFLYALHALRGAFGQLRDHVDVRAQADAAVAAVDAALPHLRGVRNSTAHADERVRGRAHGRRIDTKPVDNRMVRAPGGGVMILGALNGDNYGCTMADGHYGEVPVTPDSLAVCARVFQELLDAIPWRGPSRIVPSP